MEDCSPSIAAFCTQLRRYCTNLDDSCTTLRGTVDQRPSSLPSANLPSLLTSLIDRVSLTSQAVGTLESMTTDTISFEELLGHCMEIYKQNEASISVLEDRLKEYGYTPEDLVNDDSEDRENVYTFSELSLDTEMPKVSKLSSKEVIMAQSEPHNSFSSSSFSQDNGQLHGSSCLESDKDGVQYDSLYSGTLSLRDLGLSAAGLACLAEEDTSPGLSYHSHTTNFNGKAALQEDIPQLQTPELAGSCEDEEIETAIVNHDAFIFKPVDEYEYSSSPTWLKMQISFEDVNGFVDDICQILAKKATSNHKQVEGFGDDILDQEDLSALSSGNKLKPCLLFLVRLGRLRTVHENGATVYHVVH